MNHPRMLGICTPHAVHSRQLAYRISSDQRRRLALYPRVSIRRVRSIELVAGSQPLQAGYVVDFIQQRYFKAMVSSDPKERSRRFARKNVRLKSPGTPRICSQPSSAILLNRYCPMGTVEADMVMDESNCRGEYECCLVYESNLRDQAWNKQRKGRFAVWSRGAAYTREGRIRRGQ